MYGYKTPWVIKGYGIMVSEGRPLKAIRISNVMSCDDAERTGPIQVSTCFDFSFTKT